MKSKVTSRLIFGLSSLALALSVPSAFGVTDTFNTSGTFSWVCPGGVTSIQVECWGGGGAGGTGRKDTDTGTNTAQNGGGGGGGAYARKASVPVTAGQSYTITIPAAAAPASSTTSNSVAATGGTVTFVGDTSVTVTAVGGVGGRNAYTTVNGTVAVGGGAGGSSASGIGDVGGVFSGGVGSAGTTGTGNVSGSGGGGAGNANAGGAAVTTSSPQATTPGAGGLNGGGAGGSGVTGGSVAASAAVGSPGATPGGGGGGGHNVGQNTRLGGTGGRGQISLTYTLPVKANNTDNLNLASSWTGGGVPTPGIAEWEATVLAANTTSLGGDLTFSGIKISNPGGPVTVNSPGGFTLSLGAAAIDIDMSAATQDLTINSNLAMGAANVWNVASGRTLTLGGTVSGAFAVTKQGLGTAILSGNNNYTGNTTVTGGTLNISGVYSGDAASSSLLLGTTAAKTVVNVSNNMTLSMITGGSVANSFAVYNQTAGTVTSVGNANATLTHLANAGGYGYLNLTGGIYRQTANRFSVTNSTGTVGGAGVVYVGGTGTLDLAGTSSLIIGYAAMPASLTVGPGGSVDRSTGTGTFWLTTNPNSYGVLNIAGGDFNTAGSGIRVGNNNSGGQVGLVNLAKGTLTLGINGVNGVNAANGGTLYSNYAGGTMKAANNLTAVVPITNANLTSVSTVFGPITNNNNASSAFNSQIGTTSNFDGGLTVDTNGFAVTYPTALLRATGNGVKQANITVTGGSGYIGAPMVQFTGGTGTPAAGYAVMSGGAVTGIVITSPGDYSVDPTGVTLTGGGGTGASVALSALTANAPDSGLTKINNGTLFLTAANTYVGPTLVSGGTLRFSASFAATTNVTVAGSAESGVLVGANDEQWINTGDLTIQNNGGVLINYGSTAPSTTISPIKVTNFGIDTNAGVRLISNPGSALQVGQAYPLVTWTASGPVNGAGFTSLTHRLAGNFSVDTPTKTLLFTVTSNSAGTPISWNTGSGTWDTSSVNWLDAALAPTAYFDTLDSVLFGDASGASGNPTVTLATSVSPLGVTMNSTARDYTVSGSGGIGGAGSLTLDAANTKTLTLATVNTFTGGTFINGGTLKLSGVGTLGSSSATVTVNNGGVLDLNGTNQSIRFAAGTTVGTVANNSGSGTSILTLASNPGGNVIIKDFDTTSGGTVAVVVAATTQAPNNANSYSGGTTVNAGTWLYLNGSTPLGAGTGLITLTDLTSGLLVESATYANNITGAGYVQNNVNAASTAIFTGTLTNTGNYTFRNAGNVYDFSGSGTSSLSGVVGGTGGPNGGATGGSVIKSGTGTLTLSGANIYTGSTTVREGILNLTGNRTVTAGAITVGNLIGSTGTLNVSNGTFSTGTVTVGVGATAIGIINQSGGTLTLTGTQMILGNGSGGNGTYNLSGGTLTATSVANRGVILGTNDGGISTFNLSGTGNLLLTGALSQLMVGRADAAVINTTNVFNQTGGTASVTTLSIGGAAAGSTGLNSTFSVTGGTFSATNFSSLGVGDSGIVTMNIGGTANVTLPPFPATALGSGTTATLNFDGGTLTNSATSSSYLGSISSVFIKAGGAKFDTTNGSITIVKNLLSDVVSTGGGLTKFGTNTLTLAGANTYTGNTGVNAGALELASTGQLKFVLGATSGTNNSISGAGTVTLNGSFAIDTSAADALSSGSWTLENVPSLSGPYGASFTVVGFVDAGSDKWTKVVGAKTYTFDETTGVLTLATAGYASWASTNSASANLNEDHDNDGVANGIEYFLGGPTGNTTGFTALPGVVNTAGTLSVTWTKAASYTGTYGTDFVVETSDTLTGTWATETEGLTVTITGNDVKFTFPGGPAYSGKKFARLKVTGP